MRFLACIRDVNGHPEPVVVDTTDDRIVAYAESMDDARFAAAAFERGVLA